MAAKPEHTDCEQLEHLLTEKESDKQVSSDTPFYELAVEVEKQTLTCYFSTDKFGLFYPTLKEEKNLSIVVKVDRHVKQSESDQHTYTIANVVIKDTYLQVTDQSVGLKKRAVRFTDPIRPGKPPVFNESQLFKCQKDKKAEAKFALYTTVVDSKGHKIYYLKPEGGTIVAEESSTPDGYYYFSLRKAQTLLYPPTNAPTLEVNTGTVRVPNWQYCYIGSETKNLFYDPSPWTGHVSSNQTVWINTITTRGTTSYFVFSSEVIQGVYLEIIPPSIVVFTPPANTEQPVTSPLRYKPGQLFTRSSIEPYAFSIALNGTVYHLSPSNNRNKMVIAQTGTAVSVFRTPVIPWSDIVYPPQKINTADELKEAPGDTVMDHA